MEAVVNGNGKKARGTAKAQPNGKPRRRDFIENHERLKAMYVQMLQEGTRPTVRALAARVKMNRKSVEEHLDVLDVQTALKHSVVKLLSDQVLAGLTKKAAEGHAPEVKLWFKIVMGWEERMKIEGSGMLGNFNPKDLTTGQLERIANGEDIARVLSEP